MDNSDLMSSPVASIAELEQELEEEKRVRKEYLQKQLNGIMIQKKPNMSPVGSIVELEKDLEEEKRTRKEYLQKQLNNRIQEKAHRSEIDLITGVVNKFQEALDEEYERGKELYQKQLAQKNTKYRNPLS